MSRRNFSLQPFSADDAPPLKVVGAIARKGDKLALSFELYGNGNLAALALPTPASPPTRRHGLWQETCFEFFLGLKDSPAYWEFNLSPAGPWNIYQFTAYRQGMAEETAFASLPFAVRMGSDSLRLALQTRLAGIVPAGQALEVGVAAVLQTRDGRITYWALAHPGPEPDFHRRDSFLLAL